jgi:hypothetical protein
MHPWISNRTTTSCDGTGTGTSLSHLCLRRRREPPCSKAWQSSGGSGSPSLCLRWGRVRRRGGSGPVAGRATPHRVLLRLWAAGAPSLLYCFSAGKWPSLPLRSCADAVVLPLRAPSWRHILAAARDRPSSSTSVQRCWGSAAKPGSTSPRRPFARRRCGRR